MAIKDVLNQDTEIEVVGTAADGAEAVDLAALLQPDLITMGVAMPRMDGITAVRKIMAASPTRVIMVSTLTGEGADATFQARESGAVDFVCRTGTDLASVQGQFHGELLRKIKDAFQSTINRNHLKSDRSNLSIHVLPEDGTEHIGIRDRHFRYIGIGASTGGPAAVQEVISNLPSTFPSPLIVAIHMPKAFTGPYAARLNQKSALLVKEASEGDIMKPGQVLIAPGGKHTRLVRKSRGVTVCLSSPGDHPRNIFIPSIDIMMTSLADAVNGSMLGIILTGMGNDGFKGLKHLKLKGGITIVQDKVTSTVYGMPRVCIEGNLADEILPLGGISGAMERISIL
jgi:two-component system, chemotaxis family, protein-glutamate methylesterase/glutaminase